LLSPRESAAYRIGRGQVVTKAEIEGLKDDDQPMLFADMKKGPHRDEN
jgi:hypothetical protein